MNRFLTLALILLMSSQVVIFTPAQVQDYVWKDNFNHQNLNMPWLVSWRVSANANSLIAIISEDPKSMPANLKILGIEYDVYDRNNFTNLNVEKYLVIIVDYNVGVRGQDVQPILDISNWIRDNKNNLIKWISEGGALIDFSCGEGLILFDLIVKDAHKEENLRWIREEDTLFQMPNTFKNDNFTFIMFADAYVIGGVDLSSFNILADGAEGAVILSRNTGNGKVLFCTVAQHRSIFRRGFLENIIYWASNGSVKRVPYITQEITTAYFKLIYPSFAQSISALRETLDLVYEGLIDIAGRKPFDDERITIDFTKDLDWDMRIWAAGLAGNPIYVDVWQLPEVIGSERVLNAIIYHELGHDVFGWADFLKGPFGEAFADIGKFYAFEVLGLREWYRIDEQIVKNEFRKYVEQGSDFTRLTSSVVAGIFLTLKDQYGWYIFKHFFKIVNSSLVSHERLPYNERLSIFVHYLSVSAAHDLISEFKNWGFPIDYCYLSPTVNITSICAIGVPGPLLALNEEAFPIVSGDEDTTPVPSVVAIASRMGTGRVVALGHDGFLINEALTLFDNKQFGINIMNWLDRLNRRKVLVTMGHREWYGGSNFDAFKNELEKFGYAIVRFYGELTPKVLADVGVILIGNALSDFSPAEIDVLKSFVTDGGGLLLIGLGWPWEPYNPGKTLDDYPMNKIGEIFGVRWIRGYITDPTNNYDGQPIFHTFYPNIELQTLTSAFLFIKKITEKYQNNLPSILQYDVSIRNKYLKGHLLLATAVIELNDSSKCRSEIYEFYKDLINSNPQLFKKDVVYDIHSQSAITWIRERIYRSLIDALPLTFDRKNEIALVIGLTGQYLDIWNNFSILLLDNSRLSRKQLDFIYTYLNLIPTVLHNLRSISVADYLGEFPSSTFKMDYASLSGKDGSINIFGIEVGTFSGNEFPNDVPPKYSDVFSIVVAHEINHIVDAYYISRNQSLNNRKIELINRAGSNHMNYLRSMFEDDFFVKYPQEFFASMANQWFSDTTLTLTLALVRFDKGYKEPLNQFLFFAEVYSKGGKSTFFYTIDTEGHIIRREVPIVRDRNGHIRAIIIDKTVYNLTLDEDGNVISYIIIVDHNPPITIVSYDGIWRNSDFSLILTAADNESEVKEVYYRVNGGPVMAVSVDGHPIITTENANNTLEYWSVDLAGNEEPHKILTDIKLDKTAPIIREIRRQPEGDVEPNQPIKISVDAIDFLSGIKNVTISYSVGDAKSWTNIPAIFNVTSGLYEGVIQVQQANTIVKYKITAYDNAGNYIIEDNSGQYYICRIIPEYPSTIVLLTFITLITAATILLWRRKIPRKS